MRTIGNFTLFKNGMVRTADPTRIDNSVRLEYRCNMHHQRYVSNELTHFIGRANLNDQDAQYDLLLKIVREEELLAAYRPVGMDEAVHLQPGSHSGIILGSFPSDRKGQSPYEASVVCFCDIPIADLPIHMKRYGMFGIAFVKSFLVSMGASPVLYVARDANVGNLSKGETTLLGDKIDEMFQDLFNVYYYIMKLRIASQDKSAIPSIFSFSTLQNRIFSFIKLFDASSPADGEENFYMEREWRKFGNVPFHLKDVYRIILPKKYSERLRKDLPDYMGQITFSESVATS